MNASPDRRPAAKPHASLAEVLSAAKSLPQMFARVLVKAYRLTLSPLVGSNCRHLPTCSQYADEAFARHGLWAGGWMTLARLLRCQPFGTSGLDFVPKAPPPGARWYLPWRYGRWRGTNTIPPQPSA
jgi:putative membrane protein insertion efficiency factor